ncbi:glycosyltransferase [Advenella mimigardefordensis]|uniref:Putative glycosyltransferase n=1 Tax=Advenella mimigardefordensis (strain DSM 17166 / LMG 22922 / DPN7) TaxID=1247726 RepID=W0PBE0_ADVMD|nr:glycosyltransferase [Advenella mimigardefordensis]AHG62792.1 putative glycosyltransferase [Advenella mimigardefordensis DPN7]
MRIVIDMQGLQTLSRLRGIGRYTLAFTRALIRNAQDDEVWLLLNKGLVDPAEPVYDEFADLLPPERLIEFRAPADITWEPPQSVWNRNAAELAREAFLRQLMPDVVLNTSLFEGATVSDAVTSVGKLPGHLRTAVVFYDLIPFLDQKKYLGADWVKEWYFDKLESVKRADLLLAISDSSRQEAIDHLHVEQDHIVNISSACSDIFKKQIYTDEERRQFNDKLGISDSFVLYNGAFDSRKNIENLIAAYARMPGELRDRYQLVLSGGCEPTYQQVLSALAERLNVSGRVVMTGRVTDDELVYLFNCCELTVSPSLHEGFGLPALEAMACGAPSIGSNVTSIPEVIGLQDALFDPLDPDSIADKMVKILTDQHFRQLLTDHHAVQVKKFSWDQVAQTALQALRKMAPGDSAIRKNWNAYMAEIRSIRTELIDKLSDTDSKTSQPTEHDLRVLAACIAENEATAERINAAQVLPEKLTWRLGGPFDSSYSLAIVNRHLALALGRQGHHVALHSTEGPGDFPANKAFLDANPELARMHAYNEEADDDKINVSSRNLYPPRVNDMQGRLNLLHLYAWEESGYPVDWIEDFNSYLQGMVVVSTHVKKILIDHGLHVPVVVSGNGTDHWASLEAAPRFAVKGKGFRFLHVSSCFPRKGVEELLSAYGQAFTRHDDVTLIIKTFPNPHNLVHEWLATERQNRPDYPDVSILEQDITEAELKSLYTQCHALVAPSRAEGFGLPMAEAMLSGLPVITTGWSGQTDFCNDDTAWLVDFDFERAQSHLELFDSVWARPRVDDLARQMKVVFDMPEADRSKKVSAGKTLLQERYKWSDVAAMHVKAARSWAGRTETETPRIGWMSTWNTRCGIATYSAHLIEQMPEVFTVFAAHTNELIGSDAANIKRSWMNDDSEDLKKLESEILESGIQTLVIQFNFGFFHFEHLNRFISNLTDAGVQVVITLHSTQNPPGKADKDLRLLLDALKRCVRILVHAPGDLNRLKALGLIDNVTLFPHGVKGGYALARAQTTNQVNKPFIISSYGFFLPHKGLIELIKATAQLIRQGRNVRLKMINAEYPVADSTNLIAQAQQVARKLGIEDAVVFNTAFLPDEVSLNELSESDLIVYPYQETGESASGAVRYGLAIGVPVAVTPLSIFDDVGQAVFRLPGTQIQDIANGISALMDQIQENAAPVKKVQEEADRWRREHSYDRLSQRLFNMIKALQNDARTGSDDMPTARPADE